MAEYNFFQVYGKHLERKDLHTNMQLADDKKAQRLVSNRRFVDMTEICTGYYCVQLDKRSYREDTLLVVGSFILSKAKEVQLRFLMECVMILRVMSFATVCIPLRKIGVCLQIRGRLDTKGYVPLVQHGYGFLVVYYIRPTCTYYVIESVSRNYRNIQVPSNRARDV